MKKDSWKSEKLKYSKCIGKIKPQIKDTIFYKFAHTIRDKHLAKCTVKEVKDNSFVVYFGKDERFDMEAVKSHFFILNDGCVR